MTVRQVPGQLPLWEWARPIAPTPAPTPRRRPARRHRHRYTDLANPAHTGRPWRWHGRRIRTLTVNQEYL